jgi:O-antigen/teichoic acid export membrane protein
VDKSFLWFLAPTLLQAVAGVCVMVPVTTYYLGPADIGVVAILTALAMPVVPLSSTGDSWVLSSHWHQTSISGRGELLFNLLVANVSLKALWVGLFWVVSPILLPMLVRDYRPEYRDYFGWALLGLFAGTFWTTFSPLMVVERAPAAHAANETLQWLAGAITTLIGLSLADLGIVALLLAPIAAGIVSAAHGWYYVRSKMTGRFRGHWFKDIARSGLPAIPFSLMDVFSNTLDRFVIQRWLDLSSLGIYAHSQNYRGMFIAVTKAYSRTMTPLFLELFAGVKRDPAETPERAASGWYLCLTVAGVLVTLFSSEIIHVLTHGKFDQAASLVPLWFLLMFSHSMGVPFTQYLLTARRNMLLSGSSIVMSIGTMLLVVVCTWRFGVVGATGAAVLGSVALHTSRYLLARRYGCPYGFEPATAWGIGGILAVYLLVELVNIPFAVRILSACALVAVAWIWLSRLISFREVARALALSR